VAGACESGDEPSGFIKCWEFIDQLRTSWLLTKDCAVWVCLFVCLFIHSFIHSFNSNKITSLLLTSRDPPQVSNIYVWPTYWLILGHFAPFMEPETLPNYTSGSLVHTPEMVVFVVTAARISNPNSTTVFLRISH
jgi:hypothetical protein